MRAYQVKVQGKTKRWAGSMAECREAKKELVEEGDGAVKASAITYDETEVPTNKEGLLEFLNKNCVAE